MNSIKNERIGVNLQRCQSCVLILFIMVLPLSVSAENNPFESNQKLSEYVQRGVQAAQSKEPSYLKIIQLDDNEIEDVYQYLRNHLTMPLEILQLVLLDYPRLRLLRNEIFARHGRIFASRDLDAYFRSFTWYKPNTHFSESLLSASEQNNVSILTRMEYIEFHKKERLVKRLEFNSENNKNEQDEDMVSKYVPEVNADISLSFGGCCGSMWGSTSIQDKRGRTMFSSSFGYDGGSGTMEYLVPHWGKNLIAWISGEVKKEPVTYDRLVVLSETGEPFVDMKFDDHNLSMTGYSGDRLKQLVLISSDMLYQDGIRNNEHERYLYFLKRKLSHAPNVDRLYKWRDLGYSTAALDSRCSKKDSLITPIDNPAVLWKRSFHLSALDQIVTPQTVIFIVPEDTGNKYTTENEKDINVRYEILAFDKLTGKDKWSVKIPRRVEAYAYINNLLAVKYINRLMLIDGESGKPLWDIEDIYERSVYWYKPSLFMNNVHIVEALDEHLQIFDLKTGGIVKRINLLSHEKTANTEFRLKDRAEIYRVEWFASQDRIFAYPYYIFRKQRYEEDGQEMFQLLSFNFNGESEWLYTTKLKSISYAMAVNDNQNAYVKLIDCAIYVLDTDRIIRLDVFTGKENVITEGLDGSKDLYRPNMMLPAPKKYTLDERSAETLLSRRGEHAKNYCVPTYLSNGKIYTDKGYVSIHLAEACSEKKGRNVWGSLPWIYPRREWRISGTVTDPTVHPEILHADNNYILIKTSMNNEYSYWAIGEDALYDYLWRMGEIPKNPYTK